MKRIIIIIEIFLIIGLSVSLYFLIIKVSNNTIEKKLAVSKNIIEEKLIYYAKKSYPLNIEYSFGDDSVKMLRVTLNDLSSTYNDLEIFNEAGCDFDKTYFELDIKSIPSMYNFSYVCSNLD